MGVYADEALTLAERGQRKYAYLSHQMSRLKNVVQRKHIHCTSRDEVQKELARTAKVVRRRKTLPRRTRCYKTSPMMWLAKRCRRPMRSCALGYRLGNSNCRMILNWLTVVDYVLRHVTELRTAVTYLPTFFPRCASSPSNCRQCPTKPGRNANFQPE